MGWGLTIPLTGVALPAHAELVRALPAFGYSDLWSAETNGADAFTPLALASAWEPTLRLGTAIVPAFTRGPALIAMSAAALAAAAPGRFVLGLGASSPVIVGNWNGIAYEQPYRRTRDVLRAVRAALARVIDGDSPFTLSINRKSALCCSSSGDDWASARTDSTSAASPRSSAATAAWDLIQNGQSFRREV